MASMRDDKLKQSDAGIIPNDWDVIRISDCGQGLIPAIKAGPFGSSLTKDSYTHNGYKIYGQEQVIREDAGYGDYYIDRRKYHQLISCAIKPGDVLMSLVGTAGKVLVLPQSAAPGIINPRLIRIRLDASRIVPEFVAYYLRSHQAQERLASLAQGGTMGVLNATTVSSLTIPLPSLREQTAIIEALKDADQLVILLERLIAKNQAIKQGMMQQLLTGKTRLPSFTEPWRETTLGDHVRYVKTVALSRAQLDGESPVRYLHYGDIHTRTNVRLDAAHEPMPRARSGLLRNAGRLQVGDLVFADASEDTEGVGKSVEITGVPDAGVVPGLHTIAARFDKAFLADDYKGYLQFIPTFRQALLRLAAGTKVLATTRSFISSITLTLPDADEQRAIATVLADADKQIQQLQVRLAKAQDIKQGMMQELLSGRTRLPVFGAVS